MSVFFFNDTATTEIYTLSLHDALPICLQWVGEVNTDELRREVAEALTEHSRVEALVGADDTVGQRAATWAGLDRKSTRLNSSHSQISYAVFCLKKKKKNDDKMVYTH